MELGMVEVLGNVTALQADLAEVEVGQRAVRRVLIHLVALELLDRVMLVERKLRHLRQDAGVAENLRLVRHPQLLVLEMVVMGNLILGLIRPPCRVMLVEAVAEGVLMLTQVWGLAGQAAAEMGERMPHQVFLGLISLMVIMERQIVEEAAVVGLLIQPRCTMAVAGGAELLLSAIYYNGPFCRDRSERKCPSCDRGQQLGHS